jgi:hypothetical protein
MKSVDFSFSLNYCNIDSSAFSTSTALPPILGAISLTSSTAGFSSTDNRSSRSFAAFKSASVLKSLLKFYRSGSNLFKDFSVISLTRLLNSSSFQT